MVSDDRGPLPSLVAPPPVAIPTARVSATPEPPTPRPRTWVWVTLGVAGVVVLGAVAAAVVVLARDGGQDGVATEGVTSGRIEEGGAYLIDEVEVSAGQAVRVRLELDEDLDGEIVVLITEEMADVEAEISTEVLRAGGEDVDVAVVRREYFGDPDDVLDGDAADDYEGMVVTWVFDEGSEGEFEADFFVALADGTYLIVGSAHDGEGDARMIREVWNSEIDLEADLERIYTGEIFIGPEFFNERAFYNSDRPYEPG